MKLAKSIFFTTILTTGLQTLWMPTVTLAGLVKVSVDKGTSAGITWFVNEANPLGSDAAEDKNKDGKIEFAIPSADQAMPNLMANISKRSDERNLLYKINIIPNGVTLASLEPFDVPTFATVDIGVPLVANVDIVEFLSEGNLFSPGQMFISTDGFITETSAITFLDGSSLLPELDPEDLIESIDLLPNFTGSIKVTSSDTFTPLPVSEPSSTLGLLALSTLSVGSILKSQLKSPK